MISERDKVIQNMTQALNTQHDSSLSFAMVEHWVGSDTAISTISDWYAEIKAGEESAVKPDDIESLWKDSQ